MYSKLIFPLQKPTIMQNWFQFAVRGYAPHKTANETNLLIRTISFFSHEKTAKKNDCLLLFVLAKKTANTCTDIFSCFLVFKIRIFILLRTGNELMVLN